MRVKLLLLCLLISLGGCASEEISPSEGAGAAATPASPPMTLPIPGADSGTTTGGGSARLAWTMPEGWVEETPDNTVRRAQYRVPGADGDAECVVFYFGPGQGGDAESNALRWAGQFSQPDGRSSAEVLHVETLEATLVPVQLVEVTGTYNGGMTSIDEFPGSMLLGGIAQGPDALWFFKVIGPEATVRAQRAAFIEMMRSVRGDG